MNSYFLCQKGQGIVDVSSLSEDTLEYFCLNFRWKTDSLLSRCARFINREMISPDYLPEDLQELVGSFIPLDQVMSGLKGRRINDQEFRKALPHYRDLNNNLFVADPVEMILAPSSSDPDFNSFIKEIPSRHPNSFEQKGISCCFETEKGILSCIYFGLFRQTPWIVTSEICLQGSNSDSEDDNVKLPTTSDRCGAVEQLFVIGG